MAKDPATLWYWNDWHGGTITFSRHLKGCYMDLLHAQFNGGRLSLAQIKTILGVDFGLWPLLQEKFIKDDNDKYYNQRAEFEKEKRRLFTESRRKNLKTSHMEPHVKPHMDKHMESENENRNENVIKGRGTGGGMIFDAEVEILTNPIRLEQLAMTVGRTVSECKEILHVYHLHLTEKEQYPKSRKSVFAGFEKWLINEKKFNGSSTTSKQRGTSADRIDAAKNF